MLTFDLTLNITQKIIRSYYSCYFYYLIYPVWDET